MDSQDAANLQSWGNAIESLDYYELMRVDSMATPEELSSAFHSFARVFHPDAHGILSPSERDALRIVYQRGAEAYKVLSDPTLRARYDVALQAGHHRLDQLTISLPPVSVDWSISLDERCRSAGAKLEARRAQKFYHSGDLETAKTALVNALAHDGGANLELTRYIEDLGLRRFQTK